MRTEFLLSYKQSVSFNAYTVTKLALLSSITW